MMALAQDGRYPSLAGLLSGIAAVAAADDRPVSGLTLDSRQVKRGDLFLACTGHRLRGHGFIGEAVHRGAAAVAYDSAAGGGEMIDGARLAAESGIPLVPVPDLLDKAGMIAAAFYNRPSEALFVVGVTGTNGKTSCSHFLAQAFGREGTACGVIGTLGYGVYGRLAPATLTTPDAVTVQAVMAELRAAGTRHVVLEASSHGLEQGRLNGVAFDAALFTNLTRDHLDYHLDMDRYGGAKARLFASRGLGCAVINAGDEFGIRLLQRLPAGVRSLAYRLEDRAPAGAVPSGTEVVRGRDLRLDRTGLHMTVETPWGAAHLAAPLMGHFNAVNVLGVVSVLLAAGLSLDEATRRVASLTSVPGRMETFGGRGGRPLVVVDYAHTPDALQQVLTALRGHTAGRLWCVFGCGGDRDPGKRPQMGAIAERLADRVVVTDDNPRGERSRAIIEAIVAGMSAPDKALIIADRDVAIAHAVAGAGEDDVVLVAGKGHEEHQIIGSEKRPFSDRRQVNAALRGTP